MTNTKRAYSISGGVVREHATELQAWRGRSQFDINVNHKDIEGTEFGAEYFAVTEKNFDKESGGVLPTECLEYICNYCLPVLERLAPQMSFDGMTLHELIESPVYSLKAVKVENSTDALVLEENTCRYKPTCYLSPVRIVDLPPECDAIPRISANQISLDGRDPAIGIHGRFPVPGWGAMYFKPREMGREGEFDREVRLLSEIKTKRLSRGGIRLANLQAIVVYGGIEEKCMGMLINLIPGTDLLSSQHWTDVNSHERWKKQVIKTVEVLHAHGIVWGDVNAGNVLIDEDSNAWVIDFGGRNNPEFVDDDMAETVEGDWQGVKRLFQVWLAMRREGVPL